MQQVPVKRFQDIQNFELLRQAERNVPLCEIRDAERALGSIQSSKEESSVDRQCIALQIVALRWANPICGGCKSRDKPLQLCNKCMLVSYCSKQCQDKHWHQHHSKWCCKGDDAVMEPDCPYRWVILKTGRE